MSAGDLAVWMYLVTALLTWPFATRRLFDYFERSDGVTTHDTYVGSATAGAFLAAIWPLVLAFLFVRHPLRIYLFGRNR